MVVAHVRQCQQLQSMRERRHTVPADSLAAAWVAAIVRHAAEGVTHANATLSPVDWVPAVAARLPVATLAPLALVEAAPVAVVFIGAVEHAAVGARAHPA